MYIKFIKEHPSGFPEGAGLNTSDVFGSEMVSKEYAEKVTKAEFEKLDSSALIVSRKIAKDKAEALAAKECEDCGGGNDCEDCKSSKATSPVE